SPSTLPLLSQSQQFRGLRTEAAQLLILRLVLVHPLDGPVVPLAGLVLIAELPASHRQKEPVVAVAPLAPLHRLFERSDRRLPVARPILGGAERCSKCARSGYEFDGLLGQAHGTGWVAPRRLGVRGQGPTQQVHGEAEIVASPDVCRV